MTLRPAEKTVKLRPDHDLPPFAPRAPRLMTPRHKTPRDSARRRDLARDRPRPRRFRPHRDRNAIHRGTPRYFHAFMITSAPPKMHHRRCRRSSAAHAAEARPRFVPGRAHLFGCQRTHGPAEAAPPGLSPAPYLLPNIRPNARQFRPLVATRFPAATSAGKFLAGKHSRESASPQKRKKNRPTATRPAFPTSPFRLAISLPAS